jgi:hypothetical protein
MGRSQGSSFARCRLAVCIALALSLAGCGANALNMLMFGGAVIEAERGAPSSGEPELEPSRRVHEQDCTQPVDHSLGNIRCR